MKIQVGRLSRRPFLLLRRVLARLKLKGLIKKQFLPTPKKDSDPSTPANLENLARIAQRAIGKLGLESVETTQVVVLRVSGNSPFKKMNGQIVITLSLREPKHGEFDGLHFLRFDGINLILSMQSIAGAVSTAGAQELQTD
jgi:hypothetical protein